MVTTPRAGISTELRNMPMPELHEPSDTMLELSDVEVSFPLKRQGLFEKPLLLRAVDGVSLAVRKGETMGIVGESGSGKTTLALAVARLVPVTSGSILMNGAEILDLQGDALRNERRSMQFILQDPYSSLNPRLRAEKIVREPLDRLKIGSARSRNERVRELFEQVGLRQEQLRLFPHQFSGGQRQRIGIARAIASNPKLVICDEPVSALDMGVQAQILNLLRRLQDQLGLTYLFISHDLGVIQHMCNEITVMYMGRIVEQSDRQSLFNTPLHPYTQALLSAVPSAEPNRGEKRRVPITGEPPSPVDPPPGCRFASRCQSAEEQCRRETPLLRQIQLGHHVACHLI